MKQSYKLNSGYEIPVVGMGTGRLTDKVELTAVLEHGYESGFRMIDTAAMYGNEIIIGTWLKAKPRSEMFIITKLWCMDVDDVEAACRKSMAELGVDYIDLYLVHFPFCTHQRFNMRAVWEGMEHLVQIGLVRSIGVSNWEREHFDELLSFCSIRPAVNEIEVHPYHRNMDLCTFCKENGIHVIAYSPFGSPLKKKARVLDDPVITELSLKLSRTPAQIVLSWLAKKGYSAIPRSVKKDHISVNAKLFDMGTGDEEQIDEIKKEYRVWTPEVSVVTYISTGDFYSG